MTKEMTAKERKAHPIYTGVLKYFPNALLEVAHLSKVGNDQHNPGEPLHWAKEKSTDEGDALVRHQLDAGTRDTDGERHSAKVAWRALAQLEREILAEQDQLTAQYVGGGGGSALNDVYRYAEVEQVPVPAGGWYPKGVPDAKRRDVNED